MADLPGTLDRAKKATPCVQKLLDSRLRPWTGSKKRQLPVQSASELSPEHRGPDTEWGIPGGTSNSIGALLNAAEHISAVTQGHQSPFVRSSSIADGTDSTSPELLVPEGSQPFTSDQPEIWSNRWEPGSLEPQGEALESHRKRRRIDSFPPSSENRGSIATAEDLAGVNAQAENISILDSSDLQPPGAPISDQQGTTKVTGSKAQGPRQVAGSVETAIMADVEKLDSRLGGYLFEGLGATRMRHRENQRRVTRFTDTVRLHVAHREGEDFKLEVWVALSIGKAIAQAKMKSIDDLETLLGGYLFEAMKASNWRKEEERTKLPGCTGAVNVSLPNADDDSDCKVEVMLSFEAGQFMWAELFPS